VEAEDAGDLAQGVAAFSVGASDRSVVAVAENCSKGYDSSSCRISTLGQGDIPGYAIGTCAAAVVTTWHVRSRRWSVNNVTRPS
jgi:hypothetical protein